MSLPGACESKKKDGTTYYRSSFTYKNKHISLGSFDTEAEASKAYYEALGITFSERTLTSKDIRPELITDNHTCTIDDYRSICTHLSFDKYVTLINFRDQDIYIKTPIYMMNKYFIYYLSENEPLKFDVDDLFYYSNHTIMKRNGYLFVADYGMQVNILSRYGIKNHAVKGRDYIFINGDEHDYRYGNIEVINKYFGVQQIIKDGRERYRAIIHINGNYIIGTYKTEIEAAFAYNKAISLLQEKGIKKAYSENYLGDISAIEYAKLNTTIKISKRLRNYIASL